MSLLFRIYFLQGLTNIVAHGIAKGKKKYYIKKKLQNKNLI